MAAKRFSHFSVYTFGFLLFSICFLEGFSSEESKIIESKSAEVKTSADDKTTGTIAPGETPHEGERSSPTTDGQEVDLPPEGEKTLQIKQSEHGKTEEEVKNETKSGVQDENGKKNSPDEKESEKESEKVEEAPKEVGLELRILKDDDFEHLTQAATGATTGDWLVLFTKKDCQLCTEAEKIMKIVYERVKHRLSVAKVEDNPSSKLTNKRFNIDVVPEIYLFHNGKKYFFDGNKTVDELLKFLDGKYQTSPWVAVRKPYTFFELFVDESTEELKHMVRYKKNVSIIIFLAGFTVGISLTSLCGGILFHLLENFKDDDESERLEELPKEQDEQIKDKAE